LKKGHTEDAG